MEAHFVITQPRRDNQVDILGTLSCILKVDDEPRSKPIEDDFIEVLFFGFPIPFHSRRKILPFVVRNKQGTRVVVWVIWPPLLSIHDDVWLGKPRPILVIRHHLFHQVVPPLLPICFALFQLPFVVMKCNLFSTFKLHICGRSGGLTSPAFLFDGDLLL